MIISGAIVSTQPQNRLPGLRPWNTNRDNDTPRACFLLSFAQSHLRIMVGCVGQPKGWPVGWSGSLNPAQFTTLRLRPDGGDYIYQPEGVTMTTQLIPVFNGTINSEPALLCNARDLHSFLAVGKMFAAWITSRLEEYGFIENQDYILLSNSGKQTSGRGGHNRKDYHLTLDTAKELAMVERNEKGRQIRRYFIECEKQLHQKSSEPKIVIPRRFLVTIHPDGYQETKAISDDAYILSAEDFLRMIVGRGITVDDELLVDFSLAMLQRVYRSQGRQMNTYALRQK